MTSLHISGSSGIKIDYSTQNEQGIVASTGAVTYNTKENKLT